MSDMPNTAAGDATRASAGESTDGPTGSEARSEQRPESRNMGTGESLPGDTTDDTTHTPAHPRTLAEPEPATSTTPGPHGEPIAAAAMSAGANSAAEPTGSEPAASARPEREPAERAGMAPATCTPAEPEFAAPEPATSTTPGPHREAISGGAAMLGETNSERQPAGSAPSAPAAPAPVASASTGSAPVAPEPAAPAPAASATPESRAEAIPGVADLAATPGPTAPEPVAPAGSETALPEPAASAPAASATPESRAEAIPGVADLAADLAATPEPTGPEPTASAPAASATPESRAEAIPGAADLAADLAATPEPASPGVPTAHPLAAPSHAAEPTPPGVPSPPAEPAEGLDVTRAQPAKGPDAAHAEPTEGPDAARTHPAEGPAAAHAEPAEPAESPDAPPTEPPAQPGPYGPLPFIPPPEQQRRDSRRRLLAVAGGVLAILVLLGSLAAGGVFEAPTTRTAAPIAEDTEAEASTRARPQVTRIAPADVTSLTGTRTEALKAGNADAFVTGIDPAATELLAAQRRLFANLRLFPFTSVEFRPSTAAIDPGTDDGPLTRDVNVVFAHQITGVDSEPIAERYTWTLSRATPTAPPLITKIVGGSTRGGGNAYPAPWDEDELALIERPHVLLAVPAKNKSKAAAWADRAESALKKNLAVWQGPSITPQRFVIYVTPDHDTFTRALSGNDLPNVTGVCRTMPPARPTTRDQPMAGSRITLDGSDSMFAKNEGEQQTHLMRHELGHAMVAEFERGTEGPPLWVSEGFAEYLAWTDLSLAEWFQPDAREQVRSGKFAGKLPTDAEINSPDAKTGTVNYHYSMLTIRYIAEKYGTAKADQFVVSVYKDATPAAVDAALKEATGLDRDTFESNWAKYVKTKVGN
ncbi:hypothetical protein [Embleya sp. AB8]|uniref:hypothetical protein n=1 Tax=Embleya sp. AB8 TaxID=3156304 RepID=UPI003C7705A2